MFVQPLSPQDILNPPTSSTPLLMPQVLLQQLQQLPTVPWHPYRSLTQTTRHICTLEPPLHPTPSAGTERLYPTLAATVQQTTPPPPHPRAPTRVLHTDPPSTASTQCSSFSRTFRRGRQRWQPPPPQQNLIVSTLFLGSGLPVILDLYGSIHVFSLLPTIYIYIIHILSHIIIITI